MENKMTAVQWLLEQTMYIRSTKWPDIIEQALEMEREQHGDTWDAALETFDARGFNRVRAIVDFDDYWQEKTNLKNGEY